MDANTLLQLREYLSVAHHIPGRIRIKLKPKILTDPSALKLASSLDFSSWDNGNRPPAIINTRLNLKVGSLIIDYDSSMVSPRLLGELFSTPDAGRMEELTDQLADLLGIKANA
jgi:hypothetical protein